MGTRLGTNTSGGTVFSCGPVMGHGKQPMLRNFPSHKICSSAGIFLSGERCRVECKIRRRFDARVSRLAYNDSHGKARGKIFFALGSHSELPGDNDPKEKYLDGDNNMKGKTLRSIDPYQAAGQRLQSLLSGVGDGEEEMLNSMLMNETVEFKVTSALIAGTFISVLSYSFCWIADLDPFGGSSLSFSTFKAAAFGGLASLPLVILKYALWTDRVRRQFPFVDEILERQIQDFMPVLSSLSRLESLIILLSEVVPGILLLFPTTVGGISELLEWCGREVGFQLSPSLASVTAISITALVVATSRGVNLLPGEEEEEIIRNAVENSERYYRLMGLNSNSVTGLQFTSQADATESALAFQAVAAAWLSQKKLAARWDAALGAFEILYLGLLWQWTGDLAAPLLAAIASAAVDFGAIRSGMSPEVN